MAPFRIREGESVLLLWWFDGDPEEEWDRFVRTVEARPEFVDLASVAPTAASIGQDEV